MDSFVNDNDDDDLEVKTEVSNQQSFYTETSVGAHPFQQQSFNVDEKRPEQEPKRRSTRRQ